MIADIERLYSVNASNMKRSVIRELLKLTSKPEIISFAGGLPAPQTFPVEDLKSITMEILEKEGTKALQYGSTEGDDMLKDEIIKFMEADGTTGLTRENLLIVSASQQALDMTCKLFVNPGDPVVIGLPSYVGTISAMRSYSARTVGITLDDDGMDMEKLDKEIARLITECGAPKFIYVIPDFQNPAGITLSREKRERLLEIAYKYQVLIVEDSPYRSLRYDGEVVPSIYSLDKEGHTIGLYTFSKIFCPGFRLGWIVAPKEIINKYVIAKQAMDLCTPPFSQKIAAYYMREGLLTERINKNVELYKVKKDAMLAALDKYMPKRDDLDWTKPEGGMFLWMRLPEFMNMDDMFYRALDKNVAYVVGSAFYVNEGGKNTCRLNFSYPSLEDIDEGVKRLAAVIKEEIAGYENK